MEQQNNLTYTALAVSLLALILAGMGFFMRPSQVAPIDSTGRGGVAQEFAADELYETAQTQSFEALSSFYGQNVVYRGEIQSINDNQITVKTSIHDPSLLSGVNNDTLLAAGGNIDQIASREVSISVQIDDSTEFPLRAQSDFSVGDNVGFVTKTPLSVASTNAVAAYFYNRIPGIN